MKQQLLEAALKVIPDRGILVNVVSLRVRQLTLGHKALMTFAPGTGLADIALSEIIGKKLTFAFTPGKNGNRPPREAFDFYRIQPASDKRAA